MTLKVVFLFTWLASSVICAAEIMQGTVNGSVTRADGTSATPLTITLENRADGKAIATAVADAVGAFRFENVPFGDYLVRYGAAGGVTQQTAPFNIGGERLAVDIGTVSLASGADAPITLQKVEVTARQEAFYNSGDRKTYVVGKDLVSATGSASDLLQNVPSVQVDVDGAVSLRGDSGVSILVNGKSSAQMDRDQAAALEALSADAIERVEIITNPSAKYRPDGTAGIINIVLKKQQAKGYAGNLRGNVGGDSRYNTSLGGNYQTGKLNLHGRLGTRQDSRPRFGEETRTQSDLNGAPFTLAQRTEERARPFSLQADAGFDYTLNKQTELSATLSFGSREDTRHSSQMNQRRASRGLLLSDYDRVRASPSREREWEAGLTFTHAFDDDRELTATVEHEIEAENEEELITYVRRLPMRVDESERTYSEDAQRQTEVAIDYEHSLAAGAKLEAGYGLEAEKNDRDFRATVLDESSGQWMPDAARRDRFLYRSAVHALYGTYARPMGRFGFLAGLRFEQASTETAQLIVGARGKNTYTDLYPSLHLTYDLTDAHQLQLSYSHRIDRPDGDDLNPYLDRDDPLHLRAGNPFLRPEDVHSIEAGYQYRLQDTTYLASVYHRYRTNGITDVTRFLDATTLITTPENLTTNRSSGLELGATTRWRKNLALNFSGNLYRNEIDAQNLGFTGRRQTTAWDAKVNLNWDVTSRFFVQVNSSYRAKRLTPQGERSPSTSTNLGLRYDLKGGKTSIVATVSDAFDSLRDRTVIDTPTLQSETTRRRSSRIFYVGFVHRFGKSSGNAREDLEFDDTL